MGLNQEAQVWPSLHNSSPRLPARPPNETRRAKFLLTSMMPRIKANAILKLGANAVWRFEFSPPPCARHTLSKRELPFDCGDLPRFHSVMCRRSSYQFYLLYFSRAFGAWDHSLGSSGWSVTGYRWSISRSWKLRYDLAALVIGLIL